MAKIADLQSYAFGIDIQVNLDCLATGMTVHVGKTLLQDAEQSEFYSTRKAAEFRRQI